MTARPWWQSAVVYQVYPRSFADASGDGNGDLDGVASRLDHLVDLGVDALWLNPFYVSPMADGGYDIADHTDVDPLFGDLGAFDRLLAAAHARGLRLLIDFVPNHTSDRHPWFVASASSRDDPRRDWYVWRAGELPPNNWVSAFGGPAWTRHLATGAWYLHTFLPEQPDLNWRNPAVEEAMFGVLRFWLERGVDGVRIDVANFVLKDPQLRDNPSRDPAGLTAYRPLGAYDTQVHLHDKGHPDVHPLLRRLRRLLDGYGGVALAELHTFDWPDWLSAWASYYGDSDELHLPLNLSLVGLPLDADAWRTAVDAVEAALPDGAWPTLVLGSHDEPRVASRLGAHAARLAMTALLTLRGTPVLYYGDELGMPDVAIPADRARDRWDDQRGVSLGPSGGSTIGSSRGLGRDAQRTPMRWDAGVNAGFTAAGAEPWLPIGEGTEHVNVAAQARDPDSMLTLTRRLLALRRAHPALSVGDYRALTGLPPGVFGYVRASPDPRAPDIVVTLNFSNREQRVEPAARMLLSTVADPVRDRLAPLEARIAGG